MSLRNPHVLFLNFQAMAIRSSVLGCLIFFLGFLKGLGWFFSQCGVSTYGAVSFFLLNYENQCGYPGPFIPHEAA